MFNAKPDERIWKRINLAILDENAGVVLTTMIGGMCSLLISAKVVTSIRQARVHLAAMLLSPDDAPVGSLVPELEAELERLKSGGTLN